MPRNGSGTFTLPSGSIVTNGDTSDATDLNTPLADIEADLNTARPIVAGGTGSTSASGARLQLGIAAEADVTALLANTSFTYSAGVSQVSVGGVIETRAEGFAYRVAATGATDHHATTAGGVKLYVQPIDGGYDVAAFGGLTNGATDAGTITKNNAALTAAFSIADSSGLRVVWVRGDFAYNPASITWPTDNALHVTGTLRPQSKIVMDGNRHLIGHGGPGTVQFQRGPCARVIDPNNGDPVIQMSGDGNHTIKNIAINGCTVGIKAGGDDGINALMVMENVVVLSDKVNGIALDVDNVFWMWSTNCVFATTTTGLWSIKMDNSLRVGGQVGLIYFRDLLTSGRGCYFVSPVTAASGEMQNIHFLDWHHENLPDGDTVLVATGSVQGLFIEGYGNSDALGAFWDFDVAGCRHFVLRKAQAVIFKTRPDIGHIEGHTSFDLINQTTELGTGTGQVSATWRGALVGRYLARGHMSAAIPGVGTSITLTVPTGSRSSGDITVTGGQRAMDGSETAFLIEATGAGADTVRFEDTFYIAGRSLNAGDYVVLFGMLKSLDTTTGINSDNGAVALNFVSGDITKLTGGGRTNSEVGPIGLDHAIADDGWMPFGCAFKANATESRDLAVTWLIRKASAGFLVWRPAIRIIPATYGFTDADIHRMIQAWGPMHNANAGTVSIMEHQPFRTGLAVTASRPSATAAGEGAQFFDTTLNKPIWSDGTNWRDAAGTIV